MEISLWITNRCNMKCKYCYVDSKKGETIFKQQNIEDLIIFITNNLKSGEDIFVSFFGGEPLLAFDTIEKVVLKMNVEFSNKIQYGITTNGLMLDNKRIKFFVDNKFAVSLSWDGCEVAHDYNRVDGFGNGTYQRVREKYLNLKESGLVPVRVRATFNSETYVYLKQSVRDLLDVDREVSAIFVPDYFDNNWNEQKLNELFGIITEIRKECMVNNITIIGEEKKKIRICNGGIGSYHIYVDGRIYPCSFTVDQEFFCIGDLKQGLIQQKIDEFAKEYNCSLETCDGCDYEKYCLSYKCRYLNYVLTGCFNSASGIVCAMENIKLGSNSNDNIN